MLLDGVVAGSGSKRRARAPAASAPATAGLLGLGLDLDLGESSDDSDFRIEDHPEESDDYSIDSGPDDKENGEEDDSDDSSSLITEFGGNDKSTSQHLTVNQLLEKAKQNDFKDIAPSLTKMLICAGCLGSRSDDANEIVECDGCGVTVHEGCYGVSDVASESSTVSSASTEPWFCDACKAGVTNPACELCPNSGGIFKETEVGAWVHLVCALYVPGVAFSEVDKLTGVTLFEMAYSRWGARPCCLCEDERFSRTGICVGCDAGLCRTYFHVTCGQREGLLAEAHTEEVEQADPFYAHCKLHSDKTLIKKQKRNWLALQLRTAQRKLDIQNNTDSAVQIRTLRKLEKYRKRFAAMKELKNAPWVPTQKMPRLLPTSATACRKLMQKAKMMGIDTVASELQDTHIAALADVKKKWHIPPAFSVEFIGYYIERNHRLSSMKHSAEMLVDANADLLVKQKELDEDYNQTSKESNDAIRDLSAVKEKVTKLHACIAAICPNKAMPNVETLGVQPTPVIAIPARRPTPFPTAAALKMGVGFPLNSNPKEHAGKVLSTSRKDNSDSSLSLNNECGICRLKNDQHLLAKCDTCHLYYHLGCLKPPLARLPKKSKLYGWQCSECDKSSESEADIAAPKTVRRSRTRYSKDGIVVPDEPIEEIKQSRATDAGKSISDMIIPLKVTIKPLEPPMIPQQDPLDVYSLPDDPSTVDAVLERIAHKKEKKARKSKMKQGLCYAPSESKKSRKRSFTSPALTNTPLMSITPIVAADSPHDSPSQMDFSNPAPPAPEPSINQITSDTSFLSANSTFTSLLANTTGQNEQEHGSVFMNSSTEEQLAYKANRKRRKEKHRSRYSPDMMRPSKSHKHKRKKRSQSIEETPDVPHPRITIKIKPIPKPEGSVDPQLFYVPTDSNDGPPPDLLKKQSSKHRHKEQQQQQEEEAVPVPDFELVPAPPLTPPPFVPVEEAPKTSTRKKKSLETRPSTDTPQPSSRRSAAAAAPNPLANAELTQCDVCLEAGTGLNLVRCDECAKRYHFTCLEPPLNKNPKKRGYSWHCADCDPTDVEETV